MKMTTKISMNSISTLDKSVSGVADTNRIIIPNFLIHHCDKNNSNKIK